MSPTLTTHVIFDFGGIVMDLMSVATKLLRDYNISVGKELLPEIEANFPDSKSVDSALNEFLDSIDIKDENIRKEMKQKFLKEFTTSEFELTPGVDRLIKHLYKHNIPMAIATNGSKHEIQAFTKHMTNYFNTYFSHYICGGDDPEVKNNKPFPDVYLICAKRFKTEPKSLEKCVIFEDSMTGITGAVDSGMKTVLINDRRVCSFETIANKITSIADSFDDFRPESVGLPQY